MHIVLPGFGADMLNIEYIESYEWLSNDYMGHEPWLLNMIHMILYFMAILGSFWSRQVNVDIIRLGEEDNDCSVCYETQDVSALAGVTWNYLEVKQLL